MLPVPFALLRLRHQNPGPRNVIPNGTVTDLRLPLVVPTGRVSDKMDVELPGLCGVAIGQDDFVRGLGRRCSVSTCRSFSANVHLVYLIHSIGE